MKDFVIYTDSSCDLSSDLLKKLNIKVLGLSCNFKEKEYVEDETLTLTYKEFYDSVRNEKTMPSTSQINSFKFESAFEEDIKSGKDILYIAFSSSLSGTYNSSLIARESLLEKYPDARIEIIDAKCASSGTGLLVFEASKLKEDGQSLDEISNFVKTTAPNIMHVFMVDELDHLKRGGRVSATTAIIGGLLNIKPILYMNEIGELKPLSKSKGRKKAIKSLFAYAQNNIVDAQNQTVFISHADCLDDATTLANMIKENLNVKDVIINYIGVVIGSHTGADTIALFFKSNGREAK